MGKLRPGEVWPFAKAMCSVLWCWPLNSSLLILGLAPPPSAHPDHHGAPHLALRTLPWPRPPASLHLDSVWALLLLRSSPAIILPALSPLPTLLTAPGEICLEQTQPRPSASKLYCACDRLSFLLKRAAPWAVWGGVWDSAFMTGAPSSAMLVHRPPLE